MRIETPRLIVRSFQPTDIADYAEIVADPEVMKYIGDGSTHSLEEAQAYVEDAILQDRQSGIARYAVTRKVDGDLIGMCGFKAMDDQVDFGWRYAKTVWGYGFGTEAALAVLDYGVNTLQLRNIAAHAFLDNIASLRIIEKLGFERIENGEYGGRATAQYRQ